MTKTIDELLEENKKLKTVMIAAAEELSSRWENHCDKDGYGPVNLLRRLEEGIPAEYYYKAGDFDRLREELQLHKDFVNWVVDSYFSDTFPTPKEIYKEASKLILVKAKAK